MPADGKPDKIADDRPGDRSGHRRGQRNGVAGGEHSPNHDGDLAGNDETEKERSLGGREKKDARQRPPGGHGEEKFDELSHSSRWPKRGRSGPSPSDYS